MERPGAQRRILPNLNPSTLQDLFTKPQANKTSLRCANPLATLSLASALGSSVGSTAPRQRRLITDQEMLAFSQGAASTSTPGAFKPRRVNFTPKEVLVLLQAVRTHRELVLYGVAGGRGWSDAWVNIANLVSQAEKIHRSESDVRKKWTYLKWEAKNTSKPGRDATSRAVLNILKSQDEEGAVSSRESHEDVIHMVPPQMGKAASGSGQPQPQSAAPAAPRRGHVKVLAPKPSPPTPLPPPPEQVCLRWNSYHSNMQATFPALLTSQRYVDVTLACEGRSLNCHKIILSACSTYFDDLLSQNPCQHPIVLMKDVKFWEIEALVDFMYRGEVNVNQDKLPSLLAAAEALQIKGLAGPASIPGPSSHDQRDEGAPAPLMESFIEADPGCGMQPILAAVLPPQGRKVRRLRSVTPPTLPRPLPVAKRFASGSAIGNASGNTAQQRSVLTSGGRKRKIEPLPQPMRIKVEPPDEPASDNDANADRNWLSLDPSDLIADTDDNAGVSTDPDPGPSNDNAEPTEADGTYDDYPDPLLPEVVMAPDPGSN